jgi:hypothetical protein
LLICGLLQCPLRLQCNGVDAIDTQRFLVSEGFHSISRRTALLRNRQESKRRFDADLIIDGSTNTLRAAKILFGRLH